MEYMNDNTDTDDTDYDSDSYTYDDRYHHTSPYHKDLDISIPHCSEDKISVQYASNVVDFSSQYGSESSISYIAYNITGKPSKYPDYGDFPETFAMRTFGTLWDDVPSATTEIMSNSLADIVSQDFIVLRFEDIVYPHKIAIYETYNPGALVKIYAYTVHAKIWICLWQATAPLNNNIPKASRIFCPTIKQIGIPTNMIRLEFNHSCVEYFYEIDAVLLVGKKPKSGFDSNLFFNSGSLLKKLQKSCFKTKMIDDKKSYLQDFFDSDFTKFTSDININNSDKIDGNHSNCGSISTATATTTTIDGGNNNTNVNCISKNINRIGDVSDKLDHHQQSNVLSNLPREILFKIFSYLDLKSLFFVGRTCKIIQEISLDPFLYKEINLKEFWPIADNNLLYILRKRCNKIKKLDLSWCGLLVDLEPEDFILFLRECCVNLTHLRLNNSRFLNIDCLTTLPYLCEHLKELSLRNLALPQTNTEHWQKFKHLERLDLFYTNLPSDCIVTLLQSNPKLKHLNLGFCTHIVNMNVIAMQLGQTNPDLVSLDMWKSYGLTSSGLIALSQCTKLEEVDFGWCLRAEASPGDGLRALFEGGLKIKKLFLAAIRGLTDKDLERIANLCPNLEQIDLMGVRILASDKYLEILDKCKKLKYMDLSFCDHLDENKISIWREKYNVIIKRSAVPTDYTIPS